MIFVFSENNQELVNSKNGNRLKKRFCIAAVGLVVIGLIIAALVHYGAFKSKGSKELIERLSGRYVGECQCFNV